MVDAPKRRRVIIDHLYRLTYLQRRQGTPGGDASLDVPECHLLSCRLSAHEALHECQKCGKTQTTDQLDEIGHLSACV